ncbi:retropepsin-like domain-containing protein [Acidiphilium sp. AL]|uniref:Retropepsin-like domain-containing protein n=1 Tax=Acidiphilium iwatense TaxID=768198 RepID=A0ABS9E4I2_9PROT|nr:MULTISPECIES: aspartyl protease family protein [Acidiphilium]MCF3948567.1 retropepsin-like domain-containing protein [Acidiphilium iwatense]MCU4162012.1 retropepsin-like domain-containing protein [Acidiphilium sp. AL]
MPQLTFATQLPYGQPGPTGVRSGVSTRAYVWFRIINTRTGVASRREFGLIDSGCDVSLLDDSILQSIHAARGQQVRIGVAGGGTVTVYKAQDTEIEVEGIRVPGVPLLFGTAATPLIGRQVYLNAFDLAFTPCAWLHA